MEAVIERLRENWVACVVILGCASPLFFLFRRYTVPFFAFVLEYVVYCVAFHAVTHGVVRLVRWFNFETQMKMLADQRVDAGWQTPLFDFWMREEYRPAWVFYFEIVFVVAIFLAMLRYRPMKTQKPPVRRQGFSKGTAPRGAYQRYQQGGAEAPTRGRK